MRSTTHTRQSAPFALCLLLLSLLACDSKNDIDGIFVNQTWKLTNIYKCSGLKDDGKAMFTNKDIADAAKESDSFQITFAESQAHGKGAGTTFSGTWQANEKNEDFSLHLSFDGDPTSEVEKKFVTLLQDAEYYVGDYFSLKLFNSGKNEYLLFRRL